MIISVRNSACLLALCATVLSGYAADSASQPKNLRLEMNTGKGSKNAFGPDLQKQRELLATIQSSTAPGGEKAVACKLLTIHGTDEAIPVLAPLLADPKMASWSRIALEAIPGPAADAALRDAMGKLQGNLLIGVINSLGVRRDAKAVSALSARLADADPQVASAAAISLGKIGDNASAKALERALAKITPQTSADFAEGTIRCAENFLADGKNSQARKLYDAVRKAEVPRHKYLEATRGAILARGNDGIPMLMEELRSPEKDRFSIGLRTARELPGTKATQAIAAEIKRAPEPRQALILLALADRRDAAAIPTVVEAVRTGSKASRLTAVLVLERLASLSSVPVLVEAATSPDAELSQASVNALTRLSTEGVDAELLGRLNKSSGREREILIRVAGQRGIQSALGPILSSAENPDPKVRSAALQALGSLGTEKQVPGLVTLLEKTKEPKERGQIETAMLAISGRSPGSVQYIAPLARSSDADVRSLSLRCLSASGGPEALNAVKAAVTDKDPELQDEAVRVLSTWPNTWPEDAAVAEPLLALAKSGAKRSHQVLALRGYLQYIQGDTRLKASEKVTRIREVTDLLQRPEEKRLAVSVLGDVTTPESVDLLASWLGDDAIREDACSSLFKLGTRGVAGLQKPEKQKALQAVVDKSQNDTLKKRAEERLKAL